MSKAFFLESETGRPSAEQSLFHVIPFSFEGSVSYGKGTAAGPAELIKASQELELYDGISSPGKKGIFTHDDINKRPRKKNYSDSQVSRLFDKAGKQVESVLKNKGIPVVIGGEHSISFGPIMAAYNFCKKDLGIIQIDAHADLRLAYEGKVWSHASVMRRCTDSGVPLFQAGTRAYCEEENEYRNQTPHIHWIDARDMAGKDHSRISLPPDFPSNLYLSIDVDGLDPSVINATGTPVPGGLFWYPFFELINSLIQGRRVLAFDCVELAPRSGDRVSSFTAAQLVYNIMGIIERNGQPLPQPR